MYSLSRIYFGNPCLARFLSPDNFVQSPDYSQNFNRYTYALNNPLKYTDPDGEWVQFVIGALVGGTINWITHGVEFTWDGLKYFGIGAVAGALGAGVGAGIGVAYTGGSFGAGFIETASVTTSSLGVAGGFASGFVGGFSSGLISGTGNSLMAGNNFGHSLGAGINEGLKQGLIGGGIGGVIGGISAYSAGNHPFTGKPPHYEASLEDFSLVYQDDPMNCKNATLESIENMNGGTRNQADFKKLGDTFLQKNPNATLEEYFEHFGYKIQDPQGWTYKQIGRGMELGNPTVINENIGGGHTLTVTKIRQWTPTSNVKVWFGDPARGMWKANWSILGNSNFNNGAYLFWLR